MTGADTFARKRIHCVLLAISVGFAVLSVVEAEPMVVEAEPMLPNCTNKPAPPLNVGDIFGCHGFDSPVVGLPQWPLNSNLTSVVDTPLVGIKMLQMDHFSGGWYGVVSYHGKPDVWNPNHKVAAFYGKEPMPEEPIFVLPGYPTVVAMEAQHLYDAYVRLQVVSLPNPFLKLYSLNKLSLDTSSNPSGQTYYFEISTAYRQFSGWHLFVQIEGFEPATSGALPYVVKPSVFFPIPPQNPSQNYGHDQTWGMTQDPTPGNYSAHITGQGKTSRDVVSNLHYFAVFVPGKLKALHVTPELSFNSALFPKPLVVPKLNSTKWLSLYSNFVKSYPAGTTTHYRLQFDPSERIVEFSLGATDCDPKTAATEKQSQWLVYLRQGLPNLQNSTVMFHRGSSEVYDLSFMSGGQAPWNWGTLGFQANPEWANRNTTHNPGHWFVTMECISETCFVQNILLRSGTKVGAQQTPWPLEVTCGDEDH